MTDFTDALKTLIREAVREGIRAERTGPSQPETIQDGLDEGRTA